MRRLEANRRWGLAALAVCCAALAGAAASFATADQHAVATRVQVTLTDGQLLVTPAKLKSQLASFAVAFSVVNKGTKPHTFAIKGPGLGGGTVNQGVREQLIAPGHHATLQVTLVTGAYKLWDASARGAQAHWLVISSASGSSGAKGGSSPSSSDPSFPSGETSTTSWMQCDI